MSRVSLPRPGLPLLIALLATAAVIGTIDPAGSYPELAEGPGITLDEIFNVEMGVYQWHALRAHGWRLWSPAVRDQVFADGPGKPYNPDHPPLGRLWLGLWHDLARWIWPPVETAASTVTACARVGSAVAFGMTIWLVGAFAARWFGATAGWGAALSYVLMPRVFAHAHLAALETCMNLAFTAAVLFVGEQWGRTSGTDARPQPPRRPWLVASLAGVLIGLALLTKIQAVLLPIPIAVWTLLRWRIRGLAWLTVAGAVAAVVFVAGWPWLQIDPLAHVREYLGRGVERQTLYCWYFGERYADVNVPWHYPFVMFAVTVPLGTLLLGAWGINAGWSRCPNTRPGDAHQRQTSACRFTSTDVHQPMAHRQLAATGPRTLLLAGTILFVLAFFALPGITVYDGERLFLVVYPLWAMLVGAGAQGLVDSPSRQVSAKATSLVVALVIAAPAMSIIRLHPCQLSYYSLLTGGLRGADRTGMERSYWQDSFTRSFLRAAAERVPQGATLYLAPRLHPVQEVDLLLQSPILAEHHIIIRPYDDRIREQVRYVLVFRRRADQWPTLEPAPADGVLLAEVSREGVQLAALYQLGVDGAGVP